MILAVSPPARTSASCFDAGSKYCPCDLAALGCCVACSLLRGDEKCDCGWSGLCIYQDYLRNGRAPKPRRKKVLAPVRSRADLASGGGGGKNRAFIVEIEVPREVSHWCVFPGSFALLRPPGSPERFNVPLSVMEAKDGALSFALEVKGPKTVALDRACAAGRSVTAVAPFWSGLQGAASLRRYSSGRVLAVAKGIAQAPILHTGQYVTGHGGFFKALLGPGTLGAVFVDDALSRSGAQVAVLPKSKDHNIARIYGELVGGDYDLLVSEGSDKQHGALQELLSSLDDPPALAWSSNVSMTCAEGICGACLRDGSRGCKADLGVGGLST